VTILKSQPPSKVLDKLINSSIKQYALAAKNLAFRADLIYLSRVASKFADYLKNYSRRKWTVVPGKRSNLLGFQSQSSFVPASPQLENQEQNIETEISPLQGLNFRFPLRKYQQEIIELTKLKFERGERRVHIVAPPGAGKTIIGLQLAGQLQHNTLIISPTTTIQAQWGEKLDLFLPENALSKSTEHLIGTHENLPLKPITLLTYQVLSTPAREQEYLERLAHQAWIDEIMSTGLSQGDGEIRILELMHNNKKAYEKEMSRHITRLRRKLADILDLQEVIHKNAHDLIQALRRQKFKTVIFDECHHLTDYWAAIMTHVLRRLDNPLVIGLTGTPPEGRSQSQENRYLSLVGEIDYQVPTPALVREGGLAPFQDLVCFTLPTIEEERFLEEQHAAFHLLLEELSQGENSLLRNWVDERITSACKNGGWKAFAEANPELSGAFVRFMYKQRLPLPMDMEISELLWQAPFVDDWICLLEDFALYYLKTSASSENHQLYERIRLAIGKLGYGLTEKGIRKQASPVDRVLAFSKAKSRSVTEILEVEHRNLGDRLRTAVVTDFERMSATASRQAKGVLTEESGGAIAVLRELLRAKISKSVNPCLVTGSLILMDNRIAGEFRDAMNELLKKDGYKFELEVYGFPDEDFSELKAFSSQWESRLYVGLATKVLERGITKVLIGTRGIFGEGWDCQALNTLIDLTTTTTPVSVKQLRGRSIRINTADPLGTRKVANNWDVVCIAPHLEKGLNDYQRFARKHEGFFGICDDGQIECGVGHVHASFSELSAADIFRNLEDFNQEMKVRAVEREDVYELWKVGQSYENRTVACVELGRLRRFNLTPPFIRKSIGYDEHARLLRTNLNGVLFEYALLGFLCSALNAGLLSYISQPIALASLPIIAAGMLSFRRYQKLYKRLRLENCRPNTQDSSLFDICRAVLSALKQAKILPAHISHDSICVSQRSDGSYRLFLEGLDETQSQQFVKCIKELFAPIRKQPYMVPKYEYAFPPSRVRIPRKPAEKAGLSAFANELLARLRDLMKKEAVEIAAHSENTDEESNAETNVETNESYPKGLEIRTSRESRRRIRKLESRKNRFATNAETESEDRFFKAYLKGRAEARVANYYPIPTLFSKTEKGRKAFQSAWNKYVSHGDYVSSEDDPELLTRYFGARASIAQRMLWE